MEFISFLFHAPDDRKLRPMGKEIEKGKISDEEKISSNHITMDQVGF